MSKEYTLDIGVGMGGGYIKKDLNRTQRIGLEIGQWEIFNLVRRFPQVLSIMGSGERIPLADNSISQIEIVLPHGQLLLPGLEIDHPALKRPLSEKYKITDPNGWYDEFARVLNPKGTLFVRGDIWLHLPSILSTSSPFFTIKSIRKMSLSEFEQLKTDTSESLLKRYKAYFYPEDRELFENGLVEITMQNRKGNIDKPKQNIQKIISEFIRKYRNVI